MGLGSGLVKELAQMGVNLIIEEQYGADLLQELVKIGVNKGSKISIKADNYGAVMLKELAQQYGNKITLIV